MADVEGFDARGSLHVEQPFAIVPEWVIDAEISDCAFRLYAVLLRYGHTSGQRMPGRALLARRLHKSSTDTVDRALRELEALGAVTIERRRSGRQNLTNRYHVRTSRPGTPEGGSRTDAATPGSRAAAPAADRAARAPAAAAAAGRTPAGGRTGAATPGRTDRATVAAPVRPDPEPLTEKDPPPTPPAPTDDASAVGLGDGDAALLAACGIDDLGALAEQCQQLRRRLGLPASRWAPPQLLEALRQAVGVQQRPARAAAGALLAIAADPTTRSPVRLGDDGPWWDVGERSPVLAAEEVDELDRLEGRLREADGRRVWLQQRARTELLERGEALTRLHLARRACQLLDEVELTPC